MKPLSSTNDDLLHRIANYLVINASFTCSLGLFHGKMGIVIFFYYYARYSQNPVFEEFADELLDEVYEEVHMDMPVGLENGLCGIAWGIQYLNQHGFIEGDMGEVLSDIDERIMERDPIRMSDLSFRYGLAGIAFYVACHVGTHKENNTAFDAGYLSDLTVAKNKEAFKEESKSPFSLPELLFDDLLKITEDSNWRRLPMGIEKGLAGLGLKLMKL